MSKENVEGIIMIISCQKYKNLRINKFQKLDDYYNGWKIIYVLGDLFIQNDYELKENILIIKTEDSYLHLFKKIVLAEKFLLDIFEIKQGILKVDDDVLFNINNLNNFLNLKYKNNFIGRIKKDKNNKCKNLLNVKKELLFNNFNCYFFFNYYNKNQKDLKNKYHGLENISLQDLKNKYSKLNYFTTKFGTTGGIYYISKEYCKVLVNYMEKIKFNNLHFDNLSKCYPFLAEDSGTTFILLKCGKKMHNNQNMWMFIDEKINKNSLGISTNIYNTNNEDINKKIIDRINNIIKK